MNRIVLFLRTLLLGTVAATNGAVESSTAGRADTYRLRWDEDSRLLVRSGGTQILRVNVTSVGDSPLSQNKTLLAWSVDRDLFSASVSEVAGRRGGTERRFLVELSGHHVGEGQLLLTWSAWTGLPTATEVLEVGVLRSEWGLWLGKAFTWSMAVLIGVNTFLMGTQLETAGLREAGRRPLGPLVGLACQTTLMPTLALLWGVCLLAESPSLRLGLFAMGCSPGGGNSNFWTILLEGNLDLSVAMTAASSVAAFVSMPFWFYVVGPWFFGRRVRIPFGGMAGSLGVLVLPCGLGLAFRWRRPELRARCRWLSKATSLLMLAWILSFGSAANLYVFRLLSWRVLAAGLALPWTAYAVAYGLAGLAGRDARDRLTIAVETGIQNGGVAVLLLRFSLPEPQSDLTVAVPVAVMLFTSVPLWVLLIGRSAKALLQPGFPDTPSQAALTSSSSPSTPSTGLEELPSPALPVLRAHPKPTSFQAI